MVIPFGEANTEKNDKTTIHSRRLLKNTRGTITVFFIRKEYHAESTICKTFLYRVKNSRNLTTSCPQVLPVFFFSILHFFTRQENPVFIVFLYVTY